MGTSNSTVLRMMLAQVLVVAGIGYGLGLGGAAATGLFFDGIGLAFEMPWQVPVFGAVAVLACCMAAGMLGMVRVLRLEPGIVFKG
jgi:putative ABC transport system permease protein